MFIILPWVPWIWSDEILVNHNKCLKSKERREDKEGGEEEWQRVRAGKKSDEGKGSWKERKKEINKEEKNGQSELLFWVFLGLNSDTNYLLPQLKQSFPSSI